MKLKDQLHKNEHKTIDDKLKFNDINKINRVKFYYYDNIYELHQKRNINRVIFKV